MEVPFDPRVKDTPTEALDEFLREKHYSTTPADSVKNAYCELRDRLSRGSQTSISDNEDEELWEGAISARAAREDVLPVVKIIPTGIFAMDIPTKGELFILVAFGTISPELYHDMVWDEIQGIPGYSSFDIGVYEVNKKPVLRFLIYFKGQLFELKYFQSPELARRKQDLGEVPVFFIQQNCSSDAQDAMNELKECVRYGGILRSSSSYRRAYYTIRAWALQRGLLNESTTSQIIKFCTRPEDPSQIDMNFILRSIFARLPLGKTPYPEAGSGDWIELLTHLKKMPIHDKIYAPHYITINVMHTGCSSFQASQWLRLVESRLPKLIDSLTPIVKASENGSFSGGYSTPSVLLWPYRLIEVEADLEAKDYEGQYIIGINCIPDPQEIVMIYAALEKWREIIMKHEFALINRCFINISSEDVTRPGNVVLKKCPRTLSRPFLPAPTATEKSYSEPTKETRKPSKGNKKHVGSDDSNNPSTPSLRTASDIHNRLKHDPKNYNIDQFVMGYEDRISGKILEKPAADWIRETTDVAFIPEQRVRYFKRYLEGTEEVVWDRGLKVDKVFGSGNSALEGEEKEIVAEVKKLGL